MVSEIVCRECHFLTAKTGDGDTLPEDQIKPHSICKTKREELARHSPSKTFEMSVPYGEISSIVVISCYFYLLNEENEIVFDSHSEEKNIEYFDTINNVERDDCLFLKHKEGLHLSGAEIIQKRKEDRLALKDSIERSNNALNIAKISIWISGGLAVGSLLLNFIQYLNSIICI
jgi:hypothetical protein